MIHVLYLVPCSDNANSFILVSTLEAEDTSSSVVSHMLEQEVSLNLQVLSVVGCEVTPSNTDWTNGVMRRMELPVRRLLE